MSSLNKAMLIGRLGQDPEVRYTKSGQAVADFRMATNEFWKDRQGNRQERTEWHTVVCWGQLADFAQNYLKKGRLVFVEGRLQTRDWVDQQNVKHFKTEVVANIVRGLDRQGDSPGGGERYADYSPAGRGAQEAGQGPPSNGPESDEPYLEDDIPF